MFHHFACQKLGCELLYASPLTEVMHIAAHGQGSGGYSGRAPFFFITINTMTLVLKEQQVVTVTNLHPHRPCDNIVVTPMTLSNLFLCNPMRVSHIINQSIPGIM